MRQGKAPVWMLILARDVPSSSRIESKLLRTVVPSTKFTIKTVDIIFPVLAIRLVRAHAERVESGISISPQLEPLDRTYSLYFAEAICTAMDIGPNNVDIVEIDQVLPAQISLKLYRTFNCRELVSDRDVLVMDTNSFISCVSDSVRFLKPSAASTHSSVRATRSDSYLARAHGAAQNPPLPKAPALCNTNCINYEPRESHIVAWKPGGPKSSTEVPVPDPSVVGAEMVDMPEVGVQVESTGLTYVRPYVGGRPSDDEVKDEPEDDMLSLVAVEGDLTDRAVGTCHDTVTTGTGGASGFYRRSLEDPNHQP
ncbi:hypothetical protein F53441_303 [Fusarium austroafricanum]|uniref:Uncharacterized protein n=1 Tax=Fusarium austroafricanum TaxID=2364996 RepID=A0A8H4KYB1_9HYPO|nr:hypothetical protein F53441_303 [Fusarium austroafricanum]